MGKVVKVQILRFRELKSKGDEHLRKGAVQVGEAETAFFQCSLWSEKIKPAPWFDLLGPNPAFFENSLKIGIRQPQRDIQLPSQLALIYPRPALNSIKQSQCTEFFWCHLEKYPD